MTNQNSEFLEKTIKVWQPYSSALLTLEDGREIATTMTALFRFLSELDRKYSANPLNAEDKQHGK